MEGISAVEEDGKFLSARISPLRPGNAISQGFFTIFSAYASTRVRSYKKNPNQTKNPLENSSRGNTILLLVTDILKNKRKTDRQNKQISKV